MKTQATVQLFSSHLFIAEDDDTVARVHVKGKKQELQAWSPFYSQVKSMCGAEELSDEIGLNCYQNMKQSLFTYHFISAVQIKQLFQLVLQVLKWIKKCSKH